MGKVAIDVVLLLPKEAAEAILKLNRILLERFAPKIVLGRRDGLPHLSLAMACLEEEEIPAAGSLLEEIGSRASPIDLVFTAIEAGPIATGEVVSSLRVERSPALQSLHERVIARFGPYLNRPASPEAFIGYPAVASASVDWVTRYGEAAAFERFNPHITLGIGTFGPKEKMGRPAAGRASRLALAHLGNYCTCRKILFETGLRGSKRSPA